MNHGWMHVDMSEDPSLPSSTIPSWPIDMVSRPASLENERIFSIDFSSWISLDLYSMFDPMLDSPSWGRYTGEVALQRDLTRPRL